MAERGIVNFRHPERESRGEAMHHRVKLISAMAGAGLALAAGAACAQGFPTKPIKIVIPFVAGGSSDIVGRAIGSRFSEFLGQPAIVENRPGANGAIAAEYVAKADPDGYTMLVGSIGVFSINSALFRDLRYNPLRDFAPLTLAVTTPNVLITKPGLEASSMKELVEYAKKNPGRLSYCSSGTGSSDHLTGEVFKQGAGIFAVHVPYRGGAACQTDIMGGQIDLSFQNLGAVTNYIRAGKMKALAVTAATRHPQLPNVPTTGEAGFKDLVVTSWQAAALPAKTPRDIVMKLHDATVRTLRSPDVSARMNGIGFDVVAGSPEEFGAFMKAEVERWTKVVERGGIKPD
jgi:tripartite-type tricarboxylate transporter receptor subunit TctC